MIDQNTNEHRENEHIVDNKELSIFAALVPVIALVAMLAYNVYVFGDDALSGSNQFILLLGGAVAANTRRRDGYARAGVLPRAAAVARSRRIAELNARSANTTRGIPRS